MPVVQYGSFNTNAISAPNVYVQILPPSQTIINGVPTNIIGLVGLASWGPVNSPVTISSADDYQQNFGPMLAIKHDLGTAVNLACANFANNFRCVRVTDGTDTSATKDIMDTTPDTPVKGMTLTAKYTGTVGNSIRVTLSAGTNSTVAAPTFKAIIALPNGLPEIYDNIGGTGSALWQNLVDAINNGQGPLRAPSNLVIATKGTATLAPALTNYTLSGGANGNTTITGSVLVGSDTGTRSGMYALRKTGASVVALCDCDDTATYTAQVSFGLSEGCYMILTGAAGQAISAAIADKQTAGIDSYAVKIMLGDWVYFQDNQNNQTRLVSPQSVVAGRLANLSPERSSMNQPILGILGTQTTFNKKIYSDAEIIQLSQAGIDVITNPSPGGDYYSTRLGQSTSSNALTNTDEYCRMTNYIAYTLNSALGKYIGRLQNTSVRLEAKNTIQTFLSNLEQQGMIGDVNGGPAFKVVLDVSNNPSERVALGYMQAEVQVVFLKTIRVFLVNLQTGQVTVQ